MSLPWPNWTEEEWRKAPLPPRPARTDLDSESWRKWEEGQMDRPRTKPDRTLVGITSQRSPGQPPGLPQHQTSAEVFKTMQVFAARIAQIPTVKNAQVKPGLGRWDGGGEETWVTSYEGNGEALALLKEMGTKYNQDAVLVMHPGEGEEPVEEIAFDTPLGVTSQDELNTVMAKHGFGGWTWFKAGGKTTLRLAWVPEWPTDALKTRDDFLHAADALRAELAVSHPHAATRQASGVSLLQRGRDYPAPATTPQG
jgi:hypothetical protein